MSDDSTKQTNDEQETVLQAWVRTGEGSLTAAVQSAQTEELCALAMTVASQTQEFDARGETDGDVWMDRADRLRQVVPVAAKELGRRIDEARSYIAREEDRRRAEGAVVRRRL